MAKRPRLLHACRGGLLIAGIVLPPWAGHAVPLAAQSRPITVSVGTHSLTVPWHTGPVGNRFNPAVLVGTDHQLNAGDRFKFFYALNVGFFHNHWWMTGVSFEPEIGIGHTLLGGLQADLRLGVGYLHYFWRRKTLELEDGSYVRTADLGRPSLIVPLSATLGYRGPPAHPLPVAPFVSARWGVQALFQEEVPVMTHFVLFAGLRIARGRATPRRGR